MFPLVVFRHLDSHSLWEGRSFAVQCFQIIMYSIQVSKYTQSYTSSTRSLPHDLHRVPLFDLLNDER